MPIKVKTRGSGMDAAKESLNEFLVANYDTTKAEFDALDTDVKMSWEEAMGEDLVSAFKESKSETESQLELEDNVEKIWKSCISSGMVTTE